jgi:DNA-binding beta-propeller fold protein YncE
MPVQKLLRCTLVLAAVLCAAPAGAAIVLLRSFGDQGAAPGQLYHPYDATADAAGNVYVLDTGNHRVEVFDDSGVFVRTIGSGQGQNDGQLYYPEALALGPGDRLYIADTSNNRVSVFSTVTGNFLRKWGTEGSNDGQFLNPNGIAVSPDGPVFVTDKRNARVQKFSVTGNFLKKWGSFGSTLGQFIVPAGIAFAGSAVFVTDEQAGKLTEFGENGGTLRRYGDQGVDGPMNFPDGVSVDSSTQRAFVADANGSRVSVWRTGPHVAPGNRYLFSIAGTAEPGSGFGSPHGVSFVATATPGVSHIIVTATNDSRIYVYEEAPGNAQVTLTPTTAALTDNGIEVNAQFNVITGVCGMRLRGGKVTVSTDSGDQVFVIEQDPLEHFPAKTEARAYADLAPDATDAVNQAISTGHRVKVVLKASFPGGCGHDDPLPDQTLHFNLGD